MSGLIVGHHGGCQTVPFPALTDPVSLIRAGPNQIIATRDQDDLGYALHGYGCRSGHMSIGQIRPAVQVGEARRVPIRFPVLQERHERQGLAGERPMGSLATLGRYASPHDV